MLLRRWISIPLALIAILCVAFCIFIFFFTVYPSASPDFSYISLVALGPTSLVLCIVLLTCSGKRVNPLLITIWGAGVFFLTIPPVLDFPFLGYAGRMPLPIYLGLLKAAPIIFMLLGIASCLFAWALNRHRMNGTLVDSLTTMPVPQPVGMMTVDKVTNLLLILNRVKQSNTMPAEEYDRKRKHYLSYLTRQM